jgi:c-di-GMP-binding flagellar brake protein YcgR
MGLKNTMVLAHKAEIIDISLGGVALKSDRRLNIGREYLLRLDEKGKKLDVRGVVVRSELSGIESRADGETASIYTAGVMFKDAPPNIVSNFISALTESKKEAAVTARQKLNVRFNLITPGDKTLNFPAQFRVKEISLSGMLIETDQALSKKSLIPMKLKLQADKHVNLIGRVASCRMTGDKKQERYEIGLEFNKLTDTDAALLKSFMDYLAVREAKRK